MSELPIQDLQAGDLEARDVASVLHPATNLATHREQGPLVIERGEGVYVWDRQGRQYLEGLAGLWCTALGYGEKRLAQAAYDQMTSLSYSHLFGGKSHEPAVRLAEKLKELAPFEASKVFFGTSGSDANDTQIKLVWYTNNALGRPEKKKIISRHRGYHGVTLGSASLTGLPAQHRDFDLPLERILHTDCPHHYRGAEPGESEEDFATRLAANLDALIEREGPETVAAFIAEPVMGAGGVIVPPSSYFEKIQAVLTKHDVLLIDDEVICGFGRTGNVFGAETVGMRPDTMSVAKALSSAYVPISAVLIPREMEEALVDSSRRLGIFGHGYTYTAHPVGAAVALRNLEIFEEENLYEHAATLGKHLQRRLCRLGEHELVGEARGVGMIGAVELVEDLESKQAFDPARAVGAQCVRFCEARGLILRALGDTVAICPPLVITETQVDELFDKLEGALDDTLDWLSQSV